MKSFQWFLRFSCNNLQKASLLWLKQRNLPKAYSLEVEARLWLWLRGCQSVFGGIQCCHIITWLSLTQNEQDANLPWKRSWAHTVREWERAAVPPLFKCKYLTELINGYTINMDPVKGAGASVLPHGPKGHRVISKKSCVDPLDQYWFNLAISNSTLPSTNECFQSQQVSAWLSALTSNCDICCWKQEETCCISKQEHTIFYKSGAKVC